MREGSFKVILAAVLGACALTGCQQMPEVVEDGDIPHARGSLEQAVDELVAEGAEGGNAGEGAQEQGGWYDGIVGTEENGIWISAQIPPLPPNACRMTLQKDNLDGDTLKALLDSKNGMVRDVTDETLAEREAALKEVDQEDVIRWTYFGDDSFIIFSDGEREAGFFRNTSVYYEDKELCISCEGIYKNAPEIELTWDLDGASAEFPFERAEEILLDKLGVLGITEVNIFKIYYYELGDTAFYELRFSPSYEGIGVAHEFGQVTYGEIFPRGEAWIAEEGVARLSLDDYCGRIKDSDAGNVLSFSQITDILEEYLDSDILRGVPQAALTKVDFVYYPTYREPDLLLTPAWHIYIPSSQMQESEDGVYQTLFQQRAAWNIYIDAITGKLLKAE